MFENARNSAWLYCIDTIMNIITTRTFKLPSENADKEGVLPTTKYKMQQMYQLCAGYEAIQLHETTDKFKVNRNNGPIGEIEQGHRIDIKEKTCTCGKWQDYGCPCLDAMAYYRLVQDNTVEEVLIQTISPLFTYSKQQELFRKNVNPVIVEMLDSDNITSPPNTLIKRQPGRPKKKRLQMRSRYVNPAESKIKCSICGEAGHNKKTCEARKIAAAIVAKKKKENNSMEGAIIAALVQLDTECSPNLS
jgi:hypothetical protein